LRGEGAVLLFTIIVFTAMAVTFWYLRHPAQKNPQRDQVQQAGGNQHPFHAVSISHDGCACKVVNTVGSRRFLAATVPPLPLPSCDASSCSCRYVHHDDRRRHDNRRMVYSLRSDLYVLAGNSERRTTHGRRAADTEANLASTFDLEDINMSA